MLTIHHLQVSQSERIVWLAEELNLDYDLRLHKRSPIFSPPSITSLHPLGAAPIIQHDDLTLAESGACADYIIHKFGDGKLALPPTHKDYAEYLYWFHFSNGTLQPGLSRLMSLKMAGVQGQTMDRAVEKWESFLKHMDARLAGNRWLAGEEFTAADVMSVFTVTTMRCFCPGVEIAEYGNLRKWLVRCTQREAYVRARERADPGLEVMIQGEAPKSFFDGLKK